MDIFYRVGGLVCVTIRLGIFFDMFSMVLVFLRLLSLLVVVLRLRGNGSTGFLMRRRGVTL